MSDADKADTYEQRTTSKWNSENKTITEPVKVSKNQFDLLEHNTAELFWSAFSRIHTECGWTRITPNTDTYYAL